MRDLTSYSELSTLASCEMKWAYRYKEHEASEQTMPMAKGSAIHELVGTWWTGDEEMLAFKLNAILSAPESVEFANDLEWLFHRYTQHYGAARNGGALRVVATELKLLAPLPGTDVEVVTYVDQIVQLRNRGLWAVERKSMKDWRRLNTLDVDPQVSIELWQLRNAGWPVQGLMYDAIRTYRWQPEKPTQKWLMEHEGLTRVQAKEQIDNHPGFERPIEDSFQLLYLDRHDAHIRAALEDARSAVRRRALLGAGEVPIRNIGMNCDMCPFKEKCWEGLAFPQEIVLE